MVTQESCFCSDSLLRREAGKINGQDDGAFSDLLLGAIVAREELLNSFLDRRDSAEAETVLGQYEAQAQMVEWLKRILDISDPPPLPLDLEY